jgi:formate dehydrogenase beta subunit
MHCADPGCLKACPSPGAIVQYSNGIVDFIEEHCIGCGNCITGCPFNVPRLSKEDNRVYKCTLCSDRVAVGQEPACVKTCPTGAIRFGSKSDMKDHAAERIADLNERGYAKFLGESAKLTEGCRMLQEVDEMGFYPSLRKEAKSLARIRTFLDSKDLYFQRVALTCQRRSKG